jgi:hypothetical protein
MLRIAIRAAIFGSAAAAILLVCWFPFFAFRPSVTEIAAEQDKVYEAVVREMVTPSNGQRNVGQLVFDEELLMGGGQSCRTEAKENLRLGDSPPPFNTLADKLYRLFTRGTDAIRQDAIQDFIRRYCTGGRPSETFHTDLPRTFVRADSIYFGIPTNENRRKTFRQQFPDASGIISFSSVGFDSALDQAIVSTSDVCGMLCGTGSMYVLRKSRSGWRVINKWVVWVS